MIARADSQNAVVEQLVDKYWPMVLMRCRRLLGCGADAEDAAQEVFLKALEMRTDIRYPSTMLWTMATNHCLNILKRRTRRCEEPDGDSLLERIACSSDIEAASVARSVLRKLFDQHPVSSRTIAVLYLVDGLTLEEVAQKVGMSVAGVHKRLRALRRDLKELADV